jgi:hypothetical protein
MTQETTPKPKKKYSVEDLVKIGDGIHNSTTSFILVDNDKTDSDKGYIMFSSHGQRADVIRMFVQLFEKNPKYEEIMIEAIATYNILKHNEKNE